MSPLGSSSLTGTPLLLAFTSLTTFRALVDLEAVDNSATRLHVAQLMRQNAKYQPQVVTYKSGTMGTPVACMLFTQRPGYGIRDSGPLAVFEWSKQVGDLTDTIMESNEAKHWLLA
jgi:hypothetical protein